MLRYDFNGNQTIVEKFNKYDVFGEIFYRINISNELFVKAREKSKILMKKNPLDPHPVSTITKSSIVFVSLTFFPLDEIFF